MKEGQNRMVKKEMMETRTAEEEPGTESKEFRGFPCIYCGAKTEVSHTFPLQEAHQHPAKWLRSRRHQCKECCRSFHTNETLDAEYRTLPR